MKGVELPASGEVRARPHGCRDEGWVCTHILCPLLLGTHSVTPLRSWKPQGCPTRPLEKPACAPHPLLRHWLHCCPHTHTHTPGPLHVLGQMDVGYASSHVPCAFNGCHFECVSQRQAARASSVRCVELSLHLPPSEPPESPFLLP